MQANYSNFMQSNMKNVFLIMMVLVIGFVSKAQTPFSTPNLLTGGATKITQNKGAGQFDSGLIVTPRFTDTASANLSVVKLYPGMLIRVLDTLWMRNVDATAWNKMGGSAGSAGSYVDGIYRTPGIDSIYFTISGTTYAIKDSTDEDACDVIVDVLADIPELEDYSGNALTVIVTDSLRGGVFNYYSTSLTPDNGIVFSATGKGSGFWKRNYTESEGVSVCWFGAIPDSSTYSSSAINAAIDYQFGRGGGLVFFNPGSYIVDTTIKMKRGVYLTNQTSSYNVSDLVLQVNAKGSPTLCTKSGFSGDVILFDFQTSNQWAPWAGGVIGVSLNCTGQVSGNGIHFNQPLPTFGPANDGVVYGGIRIEHLSVVKAAEHGIYAELKVNGIFMKKVQVRESGGDGLNVAGTDLQFDEIYSWKNIGAGFYTKGTTNRMYRSDFWDNEEGGIIDEGLVNNYIRVQCDNNYKHGIWFKKGSTYVTFSRNHLLNSCRFLANGRDADSTYSEVYIDSTNGYGISVSIVGCDFSYATSHSNEVVYCVDAQYNPGFLSISDCFFGSARRASYPISDIVAQYADLSSNRSGTNLIGNKPVLVNDGGTQINANSGRIFKTQNSSATTITNIGGGRPGQQVQIIVGDNNTTFSFTTTLKSNYRTTYTAKNTDILTALCEDGVTWYVQVPAQDTSFWQRSNNVVTLKTSADTALLNKSVITDDAYFGKRILYKDTTVTANYTASSSDHHIKVNAASGNITVFLPNPFYPTYDNSRYGGELIITRVDSSTNTVTIQPGSGTVFINNYASITIPGKSTCELRSGDGTNWYGFTSYNITDGLVPTARLGSGTANSTTVLYGNNTWASPTGFQVQLLLNSFAPADATTYYIGSIPQLSGFNSAGSNRFYFNKAGTIKVADIYSYNQSPGSNEASTYYIRLNNTTDYTITTTATNNATNTHTSNTAMSVPIAVGDYIEVKWVTPSWVTNPTNMRTSVNIYLE